MKQLLLLSAILITLISCSDSDSFKSKACIAAQDFVKDDLNYPKTAKFPFGECVFEELGPNKYKVISFVTAKNAFGVEEKVYYRMELVFMGGDWTDQSSWVVTKSEYEKGK